MEVNTSSSSTTSRTSYACDACRRQKIKCNGAQPCGKCVRSGLNCTYGNATGRSTVAYTRQLEQKIAELQSALQHHPQSFETQRSGSIDGTSAYNNLLDTIVGPEDDYILASGESHRNLCHGRFGGLNILRTVRDLCKVPPSDGEVFVQRCGAEMAEALDSSEFSLPPTNGTIKSDVLPPWQRMESTIIIALDTALNCKEFIDRDEMWSQIQQLYSKAPENFDEDDRSLLALVYALMAVGRQRDPDSPQLLQETMPRGIVVKGLSYFRTSRAILDCIDCTNLNSIMALCCLASYLLSSSMISKAYACICTAASAALRMGLHVSSSALRQKLSKAGLSKRRRVFAILNIIDTIVSSVLGMPKILQHADPDQIIPVPEEDLSDEGRSLVDEHPMSPIAETIISAKLFRLLGRINQSRYPSSKCATTMTGAHGLDYSVVAGLGLEIEEWHRSLPESLPEDADQRSLRSQMLLRLQHAATEISLYRPFLHHLNREKDDPAFNYQGYAFGSSCLRASTQLVYLVESMDRQGILHEAQWYTIYLLALAASCLMFFVNKWERGPTVEDSRTAAEHAVALLGSLAQTNISARRCHSSLLSLFGKDHSSTASMAMMSLKARFMSGIGATDVGDDHVTFMHSLIR